MGDPRPFLAPSIGRAFIANPDYIEKVKTNQAITPYDESMLASLYWSPA